MRNYDFHEKLDWLEFQHLACEVIQVREDIRLQTFRPGADSGVDGLWFAEGKSIVVQAKRYQDFHSLYQDLRRSELPRVRRLNPDRYILVVSLRLSIQESLKIHRLFEGYIKESQDLVSGNELNSLLADPQYHFIEKAFTRLWMPDGELISDILEKIVHKGQRSRSLNAYQNALKACGTFVQTQTYREALTKLAANHTLVISGEPGMGKTTLAYVLALEFLEVLDSEGFIWAENLDELEARWDYAGRRQVFILDDFWGSAFHQESRRKESGRLEELIYRVKDDPAKRLIITSREYIVQQEFFKNPELKDIIEALKLECALRDYSDAEKARILFSHLKASDLEEEYLRALYYSCDRIVDHLGYSPRIIEKFLKQNGSAEYTPREYADELLGYLDYPENFWHGIFSELTEEAKIVALILAVSYTPIQLEDIRKTYGKYIRLFAGKSTPKSFEACVSELEKTFITTYWQDLDEEIEVIFENPSIVDFLYSYLRQNQEYYLPKLCESCAFYNQLLTLLERFHGKDDSLNQLIERRCAEEFYRLPMKLRDYGAPDWGELFSDEGSDWSGRACHLARVGRMEESTLIREFIVHFVSSFFDELANNPAYNGIHELPDFLGLVKLCEQKGIRLDGKEIMDKYWSFASLASHFASFQEFQEIYPSLFAEKAEGYREFMRREIKGLILDSLSYLCDYDYIEQMDQLIDDVPALLKEYGLRYTKADKEKIKSITGRYSEPRGSGEKFDPLPRREQTGAEADYQRAKAEGYHWLFDGNEAVLDDEDRAELIRCLGFGREMEEALLACAESGEPWYIYGAMEDEQILRTLGRAMERFGFQSLPRSIGAFMDALLIEMADGDPVLLSAIIGFCAEYAAELYFKESASLTEKKFKSLPLYAEYILDRPEVEKVLFTHFLRRRGKWLDLKNQLIALYCFCRAISREEKVDWDFLYARELPVIEQIDRSGKQYFYYSDLGASGNLQWEYWLPKLFNDLDGPRFRQQCLLPLLSELLAETGGAPDRVLAFLRLLKLQLTISENGELESLLVTTSPALKLLDILGIASITEALWNGLGPKELKRLKSGKAIGEKVDGKIRIMAREETDIEQLRRCGVYSLLEDFLEIVEEEIARENYPAPDL